MKGKKSFSEDLESVFHQTLYEDNLQDNPTVLLQKNNSNKKPADKKSAAKEQTPVADKKTTEEGKTPVSKSSSSRKSFSDNIDVFFKESIEDALEDTTVAEIKRSVVQQGNRKAIGIDILLQRTAVASADFSEASLEPMTKRVTFVLDADKIEQLKGIAREENKRLRFIVSELIEQYIQQHNEPKPKPTKRKK